MDKDGIIRQIVQMEWEAFDKVSNEGGRASCQDDWQTFRIMRTSQFLCWPEDALMSYAADLLRAETRGWNMVAEKYARMEKYTAPEAYARLEPLLPAVSERKESMIDEIVAIQRGWTEEFAAAHGNVAKYGRSVHAEEDTAVSTSSETYLRGELYTYSERTLEIYLEFVRSLAAEGKNLVQMIMDNTVKMYGYGSLGEVK